MKLYKRAVVKNKKIQSPFNYLNKVNELSKRVCSAKNYTDFFDINLLEEVLQAKTIQLILTCMKLLESSNAPDKTKENELFNMEIQSMTKAHFKLVCFTLFRQHYESHNFKSKNIVKHVRLLQRIFCLNEIIDDSQALYESGYFTKGHFTMVK